MLFDGSAIEHIVELAQVASDEVTARVVERRPGIRPGIGLTLVQGVPKGAKMDAIIRMGTELGVTEFVPVHSRRTVAEAKHRAARWRRIAVEASKQSRRADVPEVYDPVPFDLALGHLAGHDLILLLWEGERMRSLADALTDARSPQRVAVVIGPEGGLDHAEVEAATRRGAIPVSLGPLILRTETAGLVAVSMVLYEIVLRGARSE